MRLPNDKAFGDVGTEGGIPPGADIVFDLEVCFVPLCGAGTVRAFVVAWTWSYFDYVYGARVVLASCGPFSALAARELANFFLGPLKTTQSSTRGAHVVTPPHTHSYYTPPPRTHNEYVPSASPLSPAPTHTGAERAYAQRHRQVRGGEEAGPH